MTDQISVFKTSPATSFFVEGDLIGQSIAGNYSTVRCYLKAINGPGATTGSYYNGYGKHEGHIDGVKRFAIQEGNPFLPSGYPNTALRWRLGPYDVQVPHNADGTRAPIRFAMVLQYNPSSGPVNDTLFSAYMALPTIPRATTARFRVGSADVTEFDAGSPVTIFLDRASSSFTHDITYSFGNATGTVTVGAGVSATWTPPLSLLEQIPTNTVGNGGVTVTTKNGSTVVGVKSTDFILRAPASVVPTVTAITVSDENPDVASLIGAYVQGQSRLKAVVTAAGAYGSTIKSAMFTVDGQTVDSGQTVPLLNPGARAVSAAAVDSRGRSGTSTGTVTVLPYSPPQIPSFAVDRATSAGVLDPAGTYLKMTLQATVSSLVAGTEKNAMTVRVFTRARGTTPWTARNVISTGLSYNTSVLISGGGIFAANTAYDVRVEVSDKLQKSEDFWSVSTAGAILDSTATQVAMGKMVETAGPTSQIQGPARTYGDHTFDGEVQHRGGYPVEPVGIVTAFAGATAPAGWLLCDGAAVSRTTYAALFAAIGTAYGAGNGSSTFNLPNLKGRVPVGRDAAQTEFDALGETGGAKTHTLTQGEIPAHTHGAGPNADGFVAHAVSGSGFAAVYARSGSGDAMFFRIPEVNTPNGGAHNNLQPYIVLNHIIKAL